LSLHNDEATVAAATAAAQQGALPAPSAQEPSPSIPPSISQQGAQHQEHAHLHSSGARRTALPV